MITHCTVLFGTILYDIYALLQVMIFIIEHYKNIIVYLTYLIKALPLRDDLKYFRSQLGGITETLNNCFYVKNVSVLNDEKTLKM